MLENTVEITKQDHRIFKKREKRRYWPGKTEDYLLESLSLAMCVVYSCHTGHLWAHASGQKQTKIKGRACYSQSSENSTGEKNHIRLNLKSTRQAREKAMAPHSSTLAWKIPWMEEPGRLQSMGSRRVGHDWATSLSLFIFMHWERKWHPTPVFLPGESQGRGSLVGCRLWGRTESDTTEVT